MSLPFSFSALILFLSLSPLGSLAQGGGAASPLLLTTSDPALQQTFDWAKAQALAYVGPGSDPVGDWYEAALPGRHAFCMRDVSHQTMGAYALGLAAQNHNMLQRFAQNISDSKDWASYWEIDREGKASPDDYESDNDFWYNLPANFDVMSAALRMYQWTGDTTYIDDPVFTNFYDHTVSDYPKRWNLEPPSVLTRSRIMNRRLPTGRFVQARAYRAIRRVNMISCSAWTSWRLSIERFVSPPTWLDRRITVKPPRDMTSDPWRYKGS
jgi:hypothetical protein